MSEAQETLKELLTEWVYPKITVRANIDYSRMEIREKGFIVRIENADNNKSFECGIETLDKLYNLLGGSGVSDFQVSVENPTVNED